MLNPAPFFIHIPKCGGTAVWTALASTTNFIVGPKYFGPRAIPEADRYGMREDRLEEIYSIDELRHLAESGEAVGGHVLLSSAAKAGFSSFLVTVREPRSRLLSLYRYWQSIDEEVLLNEHGLRGEWIIDATRQDLRYFLAVGVGRLDIDNGLANYLNPHFGRKRALNWRSWRPQPNELRAFWTDELDKLVRVAQLAVNRDDTARLPELSRINETRPVGAIEKIDNGVTALLRERTRRDNLCIKTLMHENCLSYRSEMELEADFRLTADRLGFRIEDAVVTQ